MSPDKGRIVEYPANGHSSRGYLSIPRSGTGPGVLVIQEWWGLVAHIQNVADRFADAGYVALAPDLYHGRSASSPDEAGKLMMALNIEQTATDLKGSVDYLTTKSAGETLGVVGFCMGGQLALYAASRDARIGACVDFYGIHPNVQPDYSNLNAPVLGLFAEKDSFVTKEAVSELEATLKSNGTVTDFRVYPGVDHAFFNDERDVYDAEAASDAWERMQSFFSKHL